MGEAAAGAVSVTICGCAVWVAFAVEGCVEVAAGVCCAGSGGRAGVSVVASVVVAVAMLVDDGSVAGVFAVTGGVFAVLTVAVLDVAG